MSFDITKWGKLDNNPNTNINNLWGYTNTNDSLSTIKGSDYFATVSNQLAKNDSIRVVASDAREWLRVSQVSSTVETEDEGVISGAEVDTYSLGDATAFVPVGFGFSIPGGATNTQTITLNQKIKVIDFWVFLTSAGTSGDTIQLLDNGDNAISDALDVSGSDKAIVRAAEIDDANYIESSGNDLKVKETDNSGSDSPSAEAYVFGYIST